MDKETGMIDINIPNFDKGGIDSFFPKQYIISNAADQASFFEEMIFINCESYMK